MFSYTPTRSRVWLAGLALASVLGTAPGEEISEAELRQLAPLSLEELLNLPVVTASRYEEKGDDTPAHLLVITRQQIRERRYKNLADLLEDLPGIHLMRGTKSSAYNNFSIQGYTGSNRVLILLDGVRIGHPAGGTIPVAENFSLYMAKRVEILYGPASALYGADAVSGVINIITDRAQDRKGSTLSIGTGSFSSREAEFFTGFKSEEQAVALNLGGHWQRSDRADLAKVYPEEFAKQDARTFTGQLVIPAAEREDYQGPIASHSLYGRLDFGEAVTLGYYRNYFRSLTSTGDLPTTALYLKTGHWETTTDTLYGKWRTHLTPDLASELIADFSHQVVDPSSKYINIYTAFTPGHEYTRSRRLSLEENLNWRWDQTHRLQGGIGYQRYSAIEAHSLPEPYDPARGPGAQNLYYRNTDDSIPIQIQNISYWNSFLYAQVQSNWSRQFSTMIGARIDYHSLSGISVNPRLGLVWHPSENQVLKLLYGHAFRAPSPEERLKAFGSFDGSKDDQGRYIGVGFRLTNLDLEPEQVKTLSLTWDWRPRKNLRLLLNTYYSETKNLITTQPTSDTDRIPGAVLLDPDTKENIGWEIHRGFDLIAQWQHRFDADWSGDLWGSLGMVWGRASDEEDEEGKAGDSWELAYTPSFSIKLGGTLRYRDRLSITPKFYWIGDTTNGRKDRKNPPNRLKTPGYTLVNLHIGWHRFLETPVTLWLDLYNVFNTRYYAAGGSGSRTFYDMPQQPRWGMLSVEYDF